MRLASTKDEISDIMSEVMDAIERKLGKDTIQEALAKSNGKPNSQLKQIHNMLVYAVSDLAADTRMEAKFGPQSSSQFKRGPAGKLGLRSLDMSLEAAEWWWDQKDAAQYTLARKVLEKMAKKLRLPFERSKTVYASEVISRFEKGKPADPTQNMSPEDADKWRAMNEEHRDKFKTAASPVFKSLNTRDAKLIDRLVSQRTQVDWVTDRRDEKYQEQEKLEGFQEYILPRVKEQFDEINDLIRDATDRIIRRVIAFERGSLPEFKELGYDVKLGKLTPVFGGGGVNWADYDFRQEVLIADKVFGRSDTINLTWSFRSYVQMSDRKGWGSFTSDHDGRYTFIQMAMHIKDHMRRGDDWPSFLAWRTKQMEEKGYKTASNVAEEKESRFEEGKPADPTKNMSPEDAKKWREEHEKNKDKFKKADEVVDRYLKVAGFSYATDWMSVLFVEGRKPVPFNVDTIRDINRTIVPVVGDDGEIHDAFLNVIGHQYSGPLTYTQEQMGMRRETRVDVRFPVDEGGAVNTSERTALVELAKLGKKHGFTVEPVRRGYKPKTRTISQFKKVPRSKAFPFR